MPAKIIYFQEAERRIERDGGIKKPDKTYKNIFKNKRMQLLLLLIR